FPPSPKAHTVAAAESDRRHSCGLNCGYYFLVNHPAQHHQRDITSLGIGDPKPTDEFALLTKLLQHPRQRPAAAMYHGHAMSVLRQLRNRARALAQRCGILERGSSDFD